MKTKLLTCLFALILLGQNTLVLGQVDSLYAVLESADDEASLSAYTELTQYYLNVSTDSALFYARKSLDLATSLKNKVKEIEALYHLGISYRYQGEFEASESRLTAGLKMAREENDSALIAGILIGLGHVNFEQGAYEKALDSYNEAIDVSRQTKDSIFVASIYNSIGNIYEEKQDYDQAIEYYNVFRGIVQRLENKRGMAFADNNLGEVYTKKGDYNRALDYFDNAYAYREAENDERGMAQTLGNMGETYYKQGRYDDALKTLERSLKLKTEGQDKAGEASTLQIIGQVHVAKGNIDTALDYFQRGMTIADEISAQANLSEIYNSLSGAYAAAGNYKEAFEYKNRFIKLKDSIYSEQLELKVSQMESQFELEQRERELELKEQDIQIKELQIKNNQFVIYLLVISVLLLGGLGVLYFSRYRIRTKTNEMLRHQNEEIKLQKEEIGQQRDKIAETQKIIEEKNEKLSRINLELEAKVQERTRELQKSYHDQLIVNQELDTLVYKTSHDIRGPLVSMKGLCNTAMMEITDETARRYLQLLDKTSKQMNKILDRLISYNYIKNKLPEGEEVDIVRLIRQIKDSLSGLDSYSEVTFFLDTPDQLNWYTDRQLVVTIVENILENAIIFTNQVPDHRPQVKVKVISKKNLLHIFIADNGIGIPESIREQIFTMFYRGTEISSGSGMGLYISRLAIEKLGGDLRLDSDGNWTIFEIAVPQLYINNQILT